MAKRAPFVTGDKELDLILRTFPDNEVRKAVRKATRETIKNYTIPAYQKNVRESGYEDTGAMRETVRVKAVDRSRVRYGHELYMDRNKVIATREERGGEIGYDKKRKEEAFYPAMLEFGDPETGIETVAPLRKALKGNKTQALAAFRQHLRTAIGMVALRAKAKSSGATVFRDASGRFQRVAGGFASRADIDAARSAGTLVE
jgi:hypothetical protein